MFPWEGGEYNGVHILMCEKWKEKGTSSVTIFVHGHFCRLPLCIVEWTEIL